MLSTRGSYKKRHTHSKHALHSLSNNKGYCVSLLFTQGLDAACGTLTRRNMRTVGCRQKDRVDAERERVAGGSVQESPASDSSRMIFFFLKWRPWNTGPAADTSLLQGLQSSEPISFISTVMCMSFFLKGGSLIEDALGGHHEHLHINRSFLWHWEVTAHMCDVVNDTCDASDSIITSTPELSWSDKQSSWFLAWCFQTWWWSAC